MEKRDPAHTSLFGYGEYYEFVSNKYLNLRREQCLCKFVQFDTSEGDKIDFATNRKNIIGVTSICCDYISNNPDEWPKKYLRDFQGNIIMNNTPVIKGKRMRLNNYNMDVIKTYLSEAVGPKISEQYNEKSEYNVRENRFPWIVVNLIGKCIVIDNGLCKPGTYCTLYKGDDINLLGTAVPADEDDSIKYYVMDRYTDQSIIILFK